MGDLSRRSFLGAAVAAPLAGAQAQADKAAPKTAASGAARKRVHPLEGVTRENLKIKDIKVTLMSFELPPGKQWITGKAVTWKTDSILIEVFTDKGIIGIGETTPYAGPVEIKKVIDERITPALIGMNPFDVEHLAATWTPARGMFNPFAGIDVALWDIIGKAKGLPVYKLLATDGPPQPHIRMYASGGVEYAWYKRPQDLIDEAVRHKEAGYTAFKFRIGSEWANSGLTVQKYIPYLRKMREAVGPKFDLMQEINMRLKVDEVLELCPVLEELKFHWLEEPTAFRTPQAIDEHIRIKAALPTVLVSGGEQHMTRFDFKPWIDRNAYDIVQPDVNCTGLTEAWHIARMGHIKGKYCCPHNWHGGLTTMSNAALVAAIPNRHMLELNQTYNPFKEEIFKDPLVVVKGYMDLHNKPGFGMELKPGTTEKYAYIQGTYAKPNPDLPPL